MKYLLAFSIPLSGLIGFYFQGVWTFSAIIFAFGFIPIAELILPVNKKNYNEKEIKNRLENHFFDFLLYLNLPIVYGLIAYVAQKIYFETNSLTEIIGMTLSLGVILGANGINVAHELGHRNSYLEKLIAKLLLIPNHYTHFFIEHNLGHHLHVGTPKDPSTARYNQNLYVFWIQTVTGTYKKAWQIQNKLNKDEKHSLLSVKNDMFWFSIIHIIYLISIAFFLGKTVFFVLFFAGIVGFLLLECINYIEHYGLKRALLPSGRYERVSEKHSWNSNHIVGRIVLYELTRHSDHHYKSQKKYQILEYHDVSPQLPFGYPTSIIISLFPPLWFGIMNKRIPAEMK
jgi:alkane 1-monooxygenase